MKEQEELEKYALELYPEKWVPVQNTTELIDVNESVRKAFIRGYNDAFGDAHVFVAKISSEQYQKGRQEALARCPKWKRAERDVNSDTIDYAVKYLNDGGDYADYETVTVTNRLQKGELYLELSDLDELLILN